MRIATNGISLHVEQHGEEYDPALVFLHYWGGSSRTWRHVTQRLAPRHHTVAIDTRGWGLSDAPDAGYALADLAADFEDVVAQLRLKRVVLVGHSMGGKVAQLMASRRPGWLAGLVLVAPSPPTPLAMPDAARAAMAAAYTDRETVEATIDHVLTARPLAADDRAQVIADSLRGAPAAKWAWPHATSLEDISHLVGAIDVPTLVIASEADRIDPPDVLERTLLARIPHARMHVLPGAGHLSMLEAPTEIADLIDAFCETLSSHP